MTTLLPDSQRNLGKVYIGQTTWYNRQQKIKLAIADVLSNKYNIDVNEIAIKIDSSQSQAVISSLNNDIYTGSVTLNYQLDTSFVTLDYLVPDLHTVENNKFINIIVHLMAKLILMILLTQLLIIIIIIINLIIINKYM